MHKCLKCGEILGQFERDARRNHMVAKHPEVKLGKTLKEYFSVVYLSGKAIPMTEIANALRNRSELPHATMTIHEDTPDGKHYILDESYNRIKEVV